MKITDKGLEITDIKVLERQGVVDNGLIYNPDLARLIKLERVIKEVSSIPTYTPKTFTEQFVIYKSGATIRAYFYLTSDKSWRYATLT